MIAAAMNALVASAYEITTWQQGLGYGLAFALPLLAVGFAWWVLMR